MKKGTSLGFYSKRIVRLFWVFSVLIFIVLSYLTANEFANNYRNRILQQTALFNKEWSSKVGVYSYILKNGFLPKVNNNVGYPTLTKQKELLIAFRQLIGFSQVVENIFFLDKNFNITASANEPALNKNSSLFLGDREYLKRSRLSPTDVQYGEPIIGRISKKLSLPMSIGITEKSNITGYLVVSINLDKLFENLISNKISNSLEKISFFPINTQNRNSIYKLDDIKNSNISSFVMMCINSLKNQRYTIELKTSDEMHRVFFLYNGYKISEEFLRIYLARLALLLLTLIVSMIVYKLYKKNILEPISHLHTLYEEIQIRYASLLHCEINNEPLFEKTEIGNINNLTVVGRGMIATLESYDSIFKKRDQAMQSVLNYSSSALEHIHGHFGLLNEAIDDLIEDFKVTSGSLSSTKLLSYLQDLYRLGGEKIQIIETYKRLAKDMVPIINEGKSRISLSNTLNEIIAKEAEPNFRISLSKLGKSDLDIVVVYHKPFYNSILAIIKYLKLAYEGSPIELIIALQATPGNQKVIINFLTPATSLNYKKTSNNFIEEAKIYSLINCSIVAQSFDANTCAFSLMFMNIKHSK